MLEVWANCEDFMDQIFHTDNVVLLQTLLNDTIGGERYSLTINLTETTLVDQFANCLQAWVSPCDVGLGNAEHVDGSLVKSHECSVMELSQSEELENFLAGRVKLVDTIKMKIDQADVVNTLARGKTLTQIERASCYIAKII